MWHQYWLQPTVPAEPGPVLLLIHVVEDTPDRFELRLYIAGSRTLRSIPASSPDGIRRVMDAGATCNRFEGVRLSSGFNVVDPEDWRRQGIGSVALNMMIAWAKHYNPDAEVRPIALTRHRRADIAADDLRLGFYRRFGFDWANDEQITDASDWLSRPTTVARLRAAPLSPRLRYIVPPPQWEA